MFAAFVLEVTKILSIAPAAREIRLMHLARLRRAVPHRAAVEIDAEVLILAFFHEFDERFVLASSCTWNAPERHAALLEGLGKLFVRHPQRGESARDEPNTAV